MTKDEIRQWLDSIGQDRHWLAEQCASQKSTVDSWFSTKGFPPWALKIIEHLMEKHGAQSLPGADEMPLSLNDLTAFEQARIKTGHATIADWMVAALRAEAAEARSQEPQLRAGKEPTPCDVGKSTTNQEAEED